MNFLSKELKEVERKGLYRQMRRLDGPQAARTVIEGKECILLSFNNYLGLAGHPAIKGGGKAGCRGGPAPAVRV